MLAEVATVIVMATQCAVVDPIGNAIEITTQHPTHRYTETRKNTETQPYTTTRTVHYFDNGTITYTQQVPAYVRELVEEYRGTTLRVACK